jgi:hypothetical protein
MSDPRDYDRNRMEMDSRMGAPTPWGWIAGAVFIIVVLALVFTSGGPNRTASNEPAPPATTGMAPRTTPPLATIPPATTTRPAQSPSTSGQAR